MSANGLGRPTKLTAEVRAKVLDCLSVGAYAYTAAAAAGIAESTYYAWLDRGKAARDRIDAGESVHEDELEFLEFSESVTRVTAEAELRALQAVQDACLTDWRAASWFLERRHPQRWRPVARVDVDTGDNLASLLATVISVGDPEDDDGRPFPELPNLPQLASGTDYDDGERG